jgi:mannose-6-phosphate isomerase-like protein (cupin superfamily)
VTNFRVIALDEVEAIPGPGTLTWRPVRATLGLRAFGTNAYTAAQAGDDVVEPHTEDSGHQELYFVFRGAARFTLDGETFDAPAGTYVYLEDHTVHRHAVALEAGTTVMSFGGPAVFEPSPWEWYFRAAPLKRTDPARAREILSDGLRAHPESGGMYYELACLEAVNGNLDTARQHLARAVELRPEAAEWARTDEDLRALDI